MCPDYYHRLTFPPRIAGSIFLQYIPNFKIGYIQNIHVLFCEGTEFPMSKNDRLSRCVPVSSRVSCPICGVDDSSGRKRVTVDQLTTSIQSSASIFPPSRPHREAMRIEWTAGGDGTPIYTGSSCGSSPSSTLKPRSYN